mmetsp:Transcript_42515/g.52338  ORF Transcript_42515/g.52338 Transcript_42515/m.52338 type:complete len:329 (-) Transcript_42515:10-996(-)
MNKDAARNLREFGQLIVPHATPGFREALPQLKTPSGLWGALHAPATSAILKDHVFHQRSPRFLVFLLQIEEVVLPWAEPRELHDLTRRMDLFSLIQRLHNQRACRQPVFRIAAHDGIELLCSYLQSLFEAQVFHLWATILLPAGIQAPDTSSQVGYDAVARLIRYLNAIVQGVQFSHQVVVCLGHNGCLGLFFQGSTDGLNHLVTKVLEDQSCAGQLDASVCLRVCLGEGLLMVVEALFLWLIGTTHIHHNRCLVDFGCIPGSQNWQALKFFKAFQHHTSHDLIAMEAAMMSANEGVKTFWSLGQDLRALQLCLEGLQRDRSWAFALL